MIRGRLPGALGGLALATLGAAGALGQAGQIAPYVDTIQPPFRLPPPPSDPSDKIYPPPARPEPVPQSSAPIRQPYPDGALRRSPERLLPQGRRETLPQAPVGGGGPGYTVTTRKTAQAGDGGGGEAIGHARDVGRRIAACWRPPEARTPSEGTIRLSFGRDGVVIGAPRVTYAKPGQGATREELRASLLAAVERCAPLRFTPALGSAIAGRPFTLRLVSPRRGDAD